MVYVKKGMGEQRVGSHLSYYDHGMLVFIGPDIPHLPFLNYQHEDNYEIVLQIREDFMGENFIGRPEMIQIRNLFLRANQGIIFSQTVKEWSEKRLHAIIEADPFKRLIRLLDFLHELANQEDYRLINAGSASLAIAPGDFNRINRVYALIAEKYMDEVSLEQAAELASMTVPAFCRLFKRLTGKTFTQFLNEYRISKSVQLLITQDQPISEVAFACGYNSLSYFNRQFRKVTGHKPTNYRKVFKATPLF
jgi:AraC-like DNA-binding protein